MFNCSSKSGRKNADKIEGMASWFILGGVLPLAMAIVVYNQQGLYDDPFLTPDRIPYLWVIAMGIASLLVKRASIPWRGIVVLGVIGLLLAAEWSMESGAVFSSVWPLAVALLIFIQYRCDMNAARAKKTLV